MRYPDETAETVAVSSMCTDITVGGRQLAAPVMLGLFEDALAAQRDKLTPDDAPNQSVDCATTVEPGTRHVVSATRGPRPTAETRFAGFVTCMGPAQERFGPNDVATLNEQWGSSIRDLATQRPEDVNRCPNVDVAVRSTYGITEWGDVLEFGFRGCGNYLVRGYAASDSPDAFGPPSLQFLPSEELAGSLGLVYDVS